MTASELKALLPFASEMQAQKINARIEHGNNVAAARSLGCAETQIRKAIKAAKRRQAHSQISSGPGWTPTEVTTLHDGHGNLMRTTLREQPEEAEDTGGFGAGEMRDGGGPYVVKGLSTYFNANGEQRGQWVKTRLDDQKREQAFREFVEELLQPVKGLAPLTPPPASVCEQLLSVYPIGDQHHGMYAEASQTGTDYNHEISTRLLTSHVDFLCSTAPPSGTAILLDVGDFHHANCSKNETPASGHQMHVTASYGKIMQTGAMALVTAVRRLLERHKKVIVWIMPGNHNPDAAFATALALSFFFHNEPRVSVDLDTSAFKYLRFGKNLIAAHHGDGPKMPSLPLIMAVDRPLDWAETEYRVWHCGHIHHKTVKEEPGCDVETHRTLAPSNSWDHKKGYRSKREMQRIDYHAETGEYNRQRCDAKTLLIHAA